jgi:hypothetical protein
MFYQKWNEIVTHATTILYYFMDTSFREQSSQRISQSKRVEATREIETYTANVFNM